jgi:threonyl-tRNA synthetase
MVKENTRSNIFTRDDRDLLIELKTQVGNIRADIKDLRDGTSQRIKNLETDKADKNMVEKIQEKVNNDIEVRIRKVEECGIDPTEHKELLKQNNNNAIYLKWILLLLGALIAIMAWHILKYPT